MLKAESEAYIKFDNYWWIRRWDGGTQKQTIHVYFEQTDVTTFVNDIQELITWIAPNTFTVTSTAPASTTNWKINVANALVPIAHTLIYPILNTYLSFKPRNSNFNYDLSGTNGRTLGKGGNNTGYGASTLESLTTGGNNTAVGYGAGASLTSVENQTFVGFQCGHRHVLGEANTAMGSIAMEHLVEGAYNVAIGANAQGSKTKGSNNVSVGAETLWSWGECNNNTAIGHRALANGNGIGENNVAVGAFSQDFGAGFSNTSMGYRALAGTTGAAGFLTGVDNVVIGAFSGRYLGGGSSKNTSLGALALATSNLVSNTTAIGYSALNKLTTGVDNTAIGHTALTNNVVGGGNTAVGKQSLELATSNENTSLGVRSLAALSTGGSNTAVGYEAGRFLAEGSVCTFIGLRAGRSSKGSHNTAIGGDALQYQTTGDYNTALGRSALRLMQDGSNATTITNSTGVGANAAVSGDNQVQLGNSGTTPYAYAALQLRSDSRDKTDQKELTDVYSDFILGLSPKSWKWDKRDDYIHELFPMPADLSDDATDEEKVEYAQALAERNEKVKEWWSNPTKDGSHTCNRDHLGFIAQEVKELADKLGIDFAGYQDHTVNGGADVKTIAYEAFISPIVLTLQKMNTRLNAIESRLASLESK